ncbi:hypothetical protein [Celeribacter sp.]|uniref:hypothetical protein n=1 Tax=Celeribacter sp. TaxID=1890673 RepID=UPI003A943414
MYLEIIGLAVSILGLIAVLWQLGVVGKQLKLQNYSEYTRRYAEVVYRLPEIINDNEKFEISALNDNEREDFMRNQRAYFDLCFEEWNLHNRGLIDAESWRIWSGGIETALKRKAFIQAWEIIKATTEYGPDFENWVDSRILR